MEETTLTAALPNLDVRIVHRASPEDGAEAVSITLTATPDFETVGRMLAPGLPMLTPGLPMLALWMAPMQAWAGVMQRAWAPWLEAVTAGARLPGRS